jgi:sporulation protein YlmC with PRC-barrel domain
MKSVQERVRVLSASTVSGNPVRTAQGENLGKIEDFIVDLETGRIGYALLSLGGFGMGNNLFAVPWEALSLDTEGRAFVLSIDKGLLRNAPHFDRQDQPDFADRRWGAGIYGYYCCRPYWH